MNRFWSVNYLEKKKRLYTRNIDWRWGWRYKWEKPQKKSSKWCTKTKRPPLKINTVQVITARRILSGIRRRKKSKCGREREREQSIERRARCISLFCFQAFGSPRANTHSPIVSDLHADVIKQSGFRSRLGNRWKRLARESMKGKTIAKGQELHTQKRSIIRTFAF